MTKMGKPIQHIPIITSVLVVSLLLLLLNSCSREEMAVKEPTPDETIVVSAEVARQLSTRAYQEKGEVTDGKYYLTYTQTNNTKAVATVDFDKPEAQGTGIVTTPDNKELEWSMVFNEPNPTFRLDNVSPELNSGGTDPVNIVFGNNNPYKAAVFDDKDGINDLLWGEKVVQRNTKKIEFDLHHYMSRFRVEITADETNSLEGELDLSNAEVEISSIAQIPLSYNRTDGTLQLGNAPEDYTSLALVDNNKIKWKEINSQGENIKKYITQDFVLPPQSLLEDDNRPRLIIKTKDEEGNTKKVYSGILPHAMEVIYSDNTNPYPVTLSFLKEHILTIRTIITEEPPELVFMPVLVVEWVDKGNFTIEGHQAGIYRVSDFNDLIKNYETYNEFQLARYGYLTEVTKEDNTKEEKWVFNIFRQVTLEKEDIEGKMPVLEEKKDYSFNFQGYTIYIEDGDKPIPLAGQEGEKKLYDIVSGNQTP